MPDTRPAAEHLAYWRCEQCGLPNPFESSPTHCAGCGARHPERAGAPTGSSGRSWRSRLADGLRLFILVSTYIYTLLILVALGLIRWVGEGWWVVTFLLFMPRWLLLGPVAGLALLSGLVRRPSHWAIQGTTALVIAGPLMGFSVPLGRLTTRPELGQRLRVLTYNLGQGPLDARRLIAMIERERVDVVCIQEGREVRETLGEYFARGWYRSRMGTIASRYPIVAELEPLPAEELSDDRSSAHLTRVRVRAPSGVEFIVASVHMPTLRPGLNRLLHGDRRGLKIHLAWWRHELDRVLRSLSETADVPVLLAGDFNMPSDDSSMAGLGRLARFAFEEAGWGYGYTRPSRYPWFRIDHIVASPEWSFRRCWVGPDFGSDHLPLLADAVLPGPAG